MSENLIVFPTTYKGKAGGGAGGHEKKEDISAEIGFLCHHPEINKIFRMQLQTVKNVFKEDIAKLERQDKPGAAGPGKNTPGVTRTDNLENGKIEIIDLRHNIQDLSMEKQAGIFLDMFERVPEIQKRILNIFYNQILPFFDRKISSP